jgi:hypothetical protein
MKETHKMFVGALIVSQLISLIWLALFSIGFSDHIPGSLTAILTAILRLNGVLLGFSVGLYSFFLSRIKQAFTRLATMFAMTAFVSFFFSILYGFIGLLNGDEGNPLPTLTAISFTLTGVFTMIVFFVQFSVSERGHFG